MMLERVGDGKTSEKWVKAEMDCFLKREQDRALFELPKRQTDGQEKGRTRTGGPGKEAGGHLNAVH